MEDVSLGGTLKKLIYEFIGHKPILTTEQMSEIFRKAGLAEDCFAKTIEQLCKLSFLGLETGAGQFRYIADPADFRKAEAMAKKFNDDAPRYQINVPFHGYLELESR